MEGARCRVQGVGCRVSLTCTLPGHHRCPGGGGRVEGGVGGAAALLIRPTGIGRGAGRDWHNQS